MHCLADITPPTKLKHLCQILCRDNFYFEKINPRLKLLTGHRICDYLMKKRMMALQQMIDKKIHNCLFRQFCPVFTLDKFCPWQIFPFGTKFVKLWQTICIQFVNRVDDRNLSKYTAFFASVDRHLVGDKNSNVTHPIIFCHWRIDAKLCNLVSALVHDEK